MKITTILPYAKETKGTVQYALEDRGGAAISTLYVRKEALPRGAGGAWPTSITVTVDVPAEVIR